MPPLVPELPEVPLEPLVPELPEVPLEPLVPLDPEVPLEPLVPLDPEVPLEPLVPLDPEVPLEPLVPLDPEVPLEPLVPDDPLSVQDTTTKSSVAKGVKLDKIIGFEYTVKPLNGVIHSFPDFMPVEATSPRVNLLESPYLLTLKYPFEPDIDVHHGVTFKLYSSLYSKFIMPLDGAIL